MISLIITLLIHKHARYVANTPLLFNFGIYADVCLIYIKSDITSYFRWVLEILVLIQWHCTKWDLLNRRKVG